MKKSVKVTKVTKVNQPQTRDIFEPNYYVYTDGACHNNGKKSATAGIGIYFGPNDCRNVSKKVIGRQTNNVAELSAIIEAYKIIEQDVLRGKKVMIISDSTYAIGCVSSYGKKQSDSAWEDDIPNKDLVKHAYELFKNQPNIRFKHIFSHTGEMDVHSIGNDGADKLANQAIGLNSCPYDSPKIYLNVPFVMKDDAKEMGALWDKKKKKWYIYENFKNKDDLLRLFK